MADDFTPDDEDDFAPDVAAAPAGKVASPTGWRDASKKPDLLDQVVAGKEREDPAMWGALSAMAHGAAHAMEGPVNGAVAAVKQDFSNLVGGEPLHPKVSPSDAYYKEKNRIEGDQKQNLEDFPYAPIVGALMSGGAGGAPSALGRIGASGLQSAVYGFGSSKHDLGGANADPGGAAMDAGKSGLIGVGAGVVGEGLNAGAKALGNRLSKVVQSGDDAALKTAEKGFGSARSGLGGETSSNMRILESLENRLTDPSLPEDMRAAITSRLAEPDMQALKLQVIRSQLARSYDGAARQTAAREALSEAGEKLRPEAVAAASAARRNDPSALMRRVRELAPKVILPALGGALAGPGGAAAGGLASAVLGRSGTTVKNMMTDPFVASRVLGMGSAAMHGAGSAVSHSAAPIEAYMELLKDKDKP